MEKFIQHTGTALPLRRSNVDTDQIIPAVYLKRITKTGFEDGLFAAWRQDPDFILNKPERQGATILIPGQEFGTGSSREHAVWALQNYGFKVIIGSRFGDIFRNNAGKSGLLVAVVPQDVVDRLWDATEADPTLEVTVDLADKKITAGDIIADFEVDDYTQYRLINGLDDIGVTLTHQDDIAAYEAKRPSWKVTTLPLRTQD